MSTCTRRFVKWLLPPALAGVLLMLTGPAGRADDFIVYSPYVTQGQSEIEFRGFDELDRNPAINGKNAYEISVAHAFTGWWNTEFYLGEYQRLPGQNQQFIGNEFENVFQLTPEGKYWADAGFLLSYEYHSQNGVPNALEFGPLLEKHAGRFDHRVNLIWEKEIGPGANGQYEFRAAYSLSYRIVQTFAPGLEAYIRPGDQSYQIGPVFYGELASHRGNELEYSAGVVFGINPDAPSHTLLARLEYEFY